MPLTAEFRAQCQKLGIRLGVRARFNPRTRIECEPPVNIDGDVHMTGTIGAYTYARVSTGLAGVRSIGRYGSIAYGVRIGGGEHPTDWLSTHPFQYGQSSVSLRWSQKPDFAYKAAPRGAALGAIGHDVWIGTNAIVARGVSIGDGAVIGAGSVVTKDVPPYAIVGGSPARLIRYRFPPATIERLLRVRWWNYTADSLLGVRFSRIDHALDDIETLIAKGKAEPIPAVVVRITASGELDRLERKASF